MWHSAMGPKKQFEFAVGELSVDFHLYKWYVGFTVLRWSTLSRVTESATACFEKKIEDAVTLHLNFRSIGLILLSSIRPHSTIWGTATNSGAPSTGSESALRGGIIVWAYRPFLRCKFTDLCIFRMDLKRHSLRDEMVVSDQGYPDPKCSHFQLSDCTVNCRFIRATQEAKNKRLKQFNGLLSRFLHNLDLNLTRLLVVTNLVQFSTEAGKRICFDK